MDYDMEKCIEILERAKMEFIRGEYLQKCLNEKYRIYLCGDLKRPQAEKCILDKKNEIGISFYQQFTTDFPHFHTAATEYNYIISGKSKILLLDEQKEVILETGSLFVFSPMTKYITKHQAGTKILFFKSPGGNDKQLIDMTEELKVWGQSW